MAEFNELVRIKKRLCIKYKSSGCIGCPINHSMGNLCGIISISGYSDNKFMELEEALLSWAAEHPEPQYPTWGEWLESIEVIKYNNRADSINYLIRPTHKTNTQIPADIAQKLGIEPKKKWHSDNLQK